MSTCLPQQNTKISGLSDTLTFTHTQFVEEQRYNKTFYFTVVVSSLKANRVNGTAVQALRLSRRPVLLIFIKCIANCGPLVNPSYRLVLSAECKVCHNMSYTWQLENSGENTIKRLLAEDTLNGLREPVINVNPRVFITSQPETYTLVLLGQLSHVISTCV